jgi:DNA-binding winged helix-turn-helix (wHTH) protein
MSEPFTPTEARILRVLHLADGRWVPHALVVRKVWGDLEVTDPDLYAAAPHRLRVNVSRIRRKLNSSGWHIENRPGWYRAVPVVEASVA